MTQIKKFFKQIFFKVIYLAIFSACLTCLDERRRRRREEQERKDTTFSNTRLSRNGVKNVFTCTQHKM